METVWEEKADIPISLLNDLSPSNDYCVKIHEAESGKGKK